jgi:malonyl-CoA/methylmalonyl-CoA synthetase
VSLRDDQSKYRYCDSLGRELTLDILRRDLRSKLVGYKMPTLLRVIEGELPKTATGKVLKKILGPKFFPPDYHRDAAVQAWSNKKPELMSKI